MIETIERLCASLSERAYSAREAVELVGDLTERRGLGLPLIVRPRDEDFAEARVASRADEEQLSFIQLSVATSATPLTLAELAARFGGYSTPPMVHPGGPVRVIFQHDSAGSFASCAIIAELGAGPDMPARPVQAITIRPDARD